jgi:hypothetical protein
VQRFHDAIPREHCRSAFLGHRQQRFDGTPSDGPNWCIGGLLSAFSQCGQAGRRAKAPLYVGESGFLIVKMSVGRTDLGHGLALMIHQTIPIAQTAKILGHDQAVSSCNDHCRGNPFRPPLPFGPRSGDGRPGRGVERGCNTTSCRRRAGSGTAHARLPVPRRARSNLLARDGSSGGRDRKCGHSGECPRVHDLPPDRGKRHSASIARIPL